MLLFYLLLFAFELFAEVLFVFLVHVLSVRLENLLVGGSCTELPSMQRVVHCFINKVSSSILRLRHLDWNLLRRCLFAFPVFLALLDDLLDGLEAKCFL